MHPSPIAVAAAPANRVSSLIGVSGLGLLAGLAGFAQGAGGCAKRLVEVIVGGILQVDMVAIHLLDKLEADLEMGELVIDDLKRVRDGVDGGLIGVDGCHCGGVVSKPSACVRPCLVRQSKTDCGRRSSSSWPCPPRSWGEGQAP